MKNKILITIILGMFLLSLVSISAFENIDTLKEGKINQEYQILQGCSDATYINISVSNINGLFLTNVEMENNGTAWKYSFIPDTLGRHDVSYLSDGCEKTGGSYFIVTSTGLGSNNKVLLFLIGFSIILLVIGFIFKSPPVGFLSGILLSMSGIYIMIYGFGDIADLYTQAFALVVLGFGLLMMIIGLMSFFDD